MFENFFRKPELKTEKEKNSEQVMRLGEKTLLREADLKIESRRSGGYMLCSVLAMALAMGMTAGKAEAQVRGVGPQGVGLGGTIAGQLLSRGVFETGSAIDRAQNAKLDRIENEYVAGLTQLSDAQRQLEHQYSMRRTKLIRQGGNQESLRNLENSFRTEMTQLIKRRVELEREYRKQKRDGFIKREVTWAIFRGLKGW